MRWSRFFRRARWDRERATELEAYLEIETADNLARGMSPEEARRAAHLKLGSPALIREEIYRMNSIGALEILWQDFRYACRVLRRSYGFTAVAVLSLALGVGANSAVFSIVNAVLLRPLPYPEPEQLLYVGQHTTLGAVTIPQLRFWKEHSTSFASAAGYRGGGDRRLRTGDGNEWISAITVTADFLRTLGVQPALGREFNAEETRPGGPQAIVLSDGLWRRRFGSDSSILGRAIALDEATYTVVGVLPRGFWFPQRADALLPLRPTGGVGDTGTNTTMLARLKPGVSLAQAQGEMPMITARYLETRPEDAGPKYLGLQLVSLHQWLAGDVRTNLLLLFGAVCLLLAIACSNLVSLLLTRVTGRWKEIAVRAALGSSGRRLMSQFLMENIVLAALGSVAGLAVAYGLLRGLIALAPFELPSAAPIRLDFPVLMFTLLVALAIALAFTLVPFAASSRLNLHETLKAAGRVAGAGAIRSRTRSVLVAAEVALSTMLLIAAGLLIQSLYHMHQEQLGFRPEGLLTFSTPVTRGHRLNGETVAQYVKTLQERIQAAPGVRGAAAINVLPLTSQSNLPTQRAGDPAKSIGGMEVRLVTPEYFAEIGIAIRSGRGFNRSDTAAALPVALVNERVAREWWPDGRAVGDRLRVGMFRGREFPEILDTMREVVGVVADTKSVTLQDRPRPTVYIPVFQAGVLARVNGELSWIVRTSAETGGIAAALRQAIASADPEQRVLRMRPMEQIVASTTAGSRFHAWLFGLFAGIAVALAAIGVYGLLSFSVAQRRHEIGTRMALGAGRWDVLVLVLRQGLALTAIGLALGVTGALFLTRLLSKLLWGVQPNDPLSFAAVAVVLVMAGALASYLPARRASRIDPMAALRYD